LRERAKRESWKRIIAATRKPVEEKQASNSSLKESSMRIRRGLSNHEWMTERIALVDGGMTLPASPKADKVGFNPATARNSQC
jgi:hypothetical protein